jgi:hypothetical protein
MFFRIGNGVLKLHRVAIGPLRDPELPPGAYRELTEPEIESLRKAGRTSAKMQARRNEPEPKPRVAGKPTATAGGTRAGKAPGPRPAGEARPAARRPRRPGAPTGRPPSRRRERK